MSAKRKTESLDVAEQKVEEQASKKAKPAMQWYSIGPEELCDVHIVQDDMYGIKCTQMDIRRTLPGGMLHTLLDIAKVDSKVEGKEVAPFTIELPPKLFSRFDLMKGFIRTLLVGDRVSGLTRDNTRELCHAAHALAVEKTFGPFFDVLASQAGEFSPADAVHLGKLYKRPEMVTVGMRALAKPGAVIPDHLKDDCLEEWRPSVATLDAIKKRCQEHIATKRVNPIYSSGYKYTSFNFHADTDQFVAAILHQLGLPSY